LEPAAVAAAAAGRNGTKFSQCSLVWAGFHGLGVQDVDSLILVNAFFHLMEEEEEKERKKKRRK
jgi:hypothetical protein